MKDMINNSEKVVANGATSPKSFEGEVKPEGRRMKYMLICLIVCILVIIGLVIAVVVIATLKKGPTQPEICLSSDCASAAARLMDSMDPSVNPCDDFYSFSCGKWKRKNIIPEDKSGQTVFALLNDEVDVIIKYLLEDRDKYKDVEAIQKAKDMYASCIDIDTITKLGTSVATTFLEELGGWPVLGSNPGGKWNETDFNLTRLLITLRKYNNAPLINMYVSPDVKDSESRVIYLDQPMLGLSGRSYFTDQSLQHILDAYMKFATSVAVLFGVNETVAGEEMSEMVKLETDIANISMAPEFRRSNEKLYNKITISELKQNFTEPGTTDDIQFDWFDFLSGIMNLDDVNVPINQSEYVIVRDVPYFQRLFSVLQKYDKRVVANYVVWYILNHRTRNLDNRFLDLRKELGKIASGTQTSRPRWIGCVRYVVKEMSMAVGHMFVLETFDESAKAVALEMIGNIREAFSELLGEVDWMDADTSELAREKMEAMRSWIGYPSDILEIDTINKLYENVTVYRNGYFKTVLERLTQRSANGLTVLREKYEKNTWSTPPSTVNAYYNPILNNIMFPAGILQPPFYSKDQPQSMNYGAIGMIIGHEITHGFDDRGRQLDKDGNLVEWWKPGIVENFKKKAQCIVDQYSNYAEAEVNLTLNGINTQGENIADNGGLKQSYRAYRRWVEKRGSEEPTLPGLNYTNNQLFFISFGQLWCRNMRKEAIINSINNAKHSPGQFRVIGTLQNSKEFSQAFKCNHNHFMNPANKCSVW